MHLRRYLELQDETGLVQVSDTLITCRIVIDPQQGPGRDQNHDEENFAVHGKSAPNQGKRIHY